MIRRIALAAALALSTTLHAAPPSDEGWTKVNADTDIDHWIRDKDWTAGRPDSTSALVWTWVDHKRSRTVSHEMILLEINCPAEAYRFVQARSFNHRGISSPIGSTTWEFAAPQTIIGEIVRLTCMEPSRPAQTSRQQKDFW